VFTQGVLDNDPPVLKDIYPTGTIGTGERLSFAAGPTDNIAVTTVTVAYWYGSNDGDARTVPLSAHGEPKQGIQYYYSDIVTIPDRSLAPLHYIVAIADDAENVFTSDVVNVSIVDKIEPWAIEDLSDVNASTGEDFWFRVNVTDNIGVARVDLYFDGRSMMMSIEQFFGNGSGIYVHRMTLDDYRTVDVNYSFRITDTNGNEGYGPDVSVPVMDVLAPSVAMENRSPPVKGVVYQVRAYARDNVELAEVICEYWWTDAPHQNITLVKVEPYPGPYFAPWIPSFTHHGFIPIPRHPVGRLNFFVRAVDTEGHVRTTEPKWFHPINYAPSMENPGYWNVTEETEQSLDLEQLISDRNDPLANLTVEVLSDNAWLDGLLLKVHFAEWSPEVTIRLRISDGEDPLLANVTVRMTNVNDHPEIIRVEPSTDAEFYEGTPIPFKAVVEDEDHDPLTITWWRGIEVLHVGEKFNATGLGPGRHIIIVYVHDGTVEMSQEVIVHVREVEIPDDGGQVEMFNVWMFAVAIALAATAILVLLLMRAARDG
jgi:hypothetical protein